MFIMTKGTSRIISRSNACNANMWEHGCQQVKCLQCKQVGTEMLVGQILVVQISRSSLSVYTANRQDQNSQYVKRLYCKLVAVGLSVSQMFYSAVNVACFNHNELLRDKKNYCDISHPRNKVRKQFIKWLYDFTKAMSPNKFM